MFLFCYVWIGICLFLYTYILAYIACIANNQKTFVDNYIFYILT